MSWFRKPDKIAEIDIVKPEIEIFSTVQRWQNFVDICMAYKIEIVSTEGAHMVIKGRPKNVDLFLVSFRAKQMVGVV